jgi:hypothetical protein
MQNESNGYIRCSIPSLNNSNLKREYLHRIMYYVFNPECYMVKGYDIHHIDSDRSNNNINNLELITHKENCNLRRPIIRLQNNTPVYSIKDNVRKDFRSANQACIYYNTTYVYHILKFTNNQLYLKDGTTFYYS